MDDKYRNYLLSKEWKAKREQLFQQRGRLCEICGNKYQLEIHHITYDRIYNESDKDLLIVCHGCHSSLHKKKPQRKGLKKKQSKKLSPTSKRKLAMKKAISAEQNRKNRRK